MNSSDHPDTAPYAAIQVDVDQLTEAASRQDLTDTGATFRDATAEYPAVFDVAGRTHDGRIRANTEVLSRLDVEIGEDSTGLGDPGAVAPPERARGSATADTREHLAAGRPYAVFQNHVRW